MSHSILVVDDSATTRMMVRRVIKLCDPSAMTLVDACDGREGLKLLREQQFDLVLTDLHMPGMGGIEMVRQIRADPQLEGTTIVVISADPNVTLDSELQALGIKGYLGKPFTPENFRDVLTPLLGAISHA